MKLDLIPVFEKIIVKEKEIKQSGTIIIPETKGAKAEMRACEGVILAVGPDVVGLKKGDKVYYGKYSGFELKWNGETYWCMNDVDVIALIKEES